MMLSTLLQFCIVIVMQIKLTVVVVVVVVVWESSFFIVSNNYHSMSPAESKLFQVCPWKIVFVSYYKNSMTSIKVK